MVDEVTPFMNEERMPETTCPVCGKILDGASTMSSGGRPKGGDISVCIYCARVLVFTDTLELRKPTPAEYTTFMQMPEVRRTVSAVKQVIGKHRTK